MTTIHMGLNTEPPNSPYNYDKSKAVELEKAIHEALKQHGNCRLSWSCEGRTRHEMHASSWRRYLEEQGYNYNFTIGYNYLCEVTV